MSNYLACHASHEQYEDSHSKVFVHSSLLCCIGFQSSFLSLSDKGRGICQSVAVQIATHLFCCSKNVSSCDSRRKIWTSLIRRLWSWFACARIIVIYRVWCGFSTICASMKTSNSVISKPISIHCTGTRVRWINSSTTMTALDLAVGTDHL